MSYFEDYRKAHDEWVDDISLEGLRNTLRETQEHLTAFEKPYLDRMKAAEEGIKETVLDQQRTMVLHGVEAIFTKPRKSTSWKGVALTFDPSSELIEEHSKTGHPSVKIKVQEIQMETHITTHREEEDEVPF